jgi:D-sedoheptulose 7-phosphate isomerase
MLNKFAKIEKLLNLMENDSPFLESIEKSKKVITDSIDKKCKLLVCGNGGSGTQASHMVGEFVGRFAFDRPALPAISLYDLATTTAIGNDYGYDDVFSRFVDGLGNNGDVLLSISTSGNSKNCLKAMNSAKDKGVKNIALLGRDGGKMKDLADVAIIIPADETPLIQELHLVVIHWLCERVENHFFGK